MIVTEYERDLETLLDYLKRSRGFDFTGYKRSSLMRRIQRRMEMVEAETFGDYVDFLEVHPDEFAQLFNMILINVTSFFRDPLIWEHLKTEILPRLLDSKAENSPIRIWSAGCASGEEAYSIAILLAEILGLDEYRRRVKIYGTDIDEDALGAARAAIYSERQVQGVPASLLETYFEPINHHFVFHRELRRSVIFGRHDLIQDAPISRVDLLICRNTLMYFNAATQARTMSSFHFALNDFGFMLLGKAEMMFSHSGLFVPTDLKRRVFSKVLTPSSRERQTVTLDGQDGYHLANETRVRAMVFDAELSAQIVVDPDGRLALANDRARVLFRLTPGDVGRPLQDLELSYRPADLRSAIEQALHERRSLGLKDVAYANPAGDAVSLDVQITPLQDGLPQIGLTPAQLGVSVTFADVSYHKRLQDDLQTANQELETSNEELQSTTEELETTNEELQSTNEELETTNEELQSTNEELETMNAELQSTNEELETVNDELRNRSAELSKISLFLEAILASLQGGVIVVDAEMRVQIWNRQSEELWGLRADEVMDKNLLGLDIGLPVESLLPCLRACLAGETSTDETLLTAINRRGRTIRCHIACMPLREDAQTTRGVVVIVTEAPAENA